MSIHAAYARVAQLQSLLAPAAPAPAQVAPPASAGAPSAFAGTLRAATGSQTVAAVPQAAGAVPFAPSTLPVPAAGPVTGGTPAGQAIVERVRAEVGQAESPPGSNDSPRIAQYRQATAGAMAGAPWCAYFVSWAAREAGVPLGESGQGFGAVEGVWGWAQKAGKAMPAGAGTRPQPGDLIVWGGRHIGIVESVGADGAVHTIEGNSSHAVTRRSYGPDGGGATGYVRLG